MAARGDRVGIRRVMGIRIAEVGLRDGWYRIPSVAGVEVCRKGGGFAGSINVPEISRWVDYIADSLLELLYF